MSVSSIYPLPKRIRQSSLSTLQATLTPPDLYVLPRRHQDVSGPQCHAPHTALGIDFVVSFLFVSLDRVSCVFGG